MEMEIDDDANHGLALPKQEEYKLATPQCNKVCLLVLTFEG